jgi:two-component system, sensor histidine kinase RpfC
MMARLGVDLSTMERVKRRPVRRHRERETRDVSALISVGPRERSVLIVEADPEVQVQMARVLRREGHRVVGTSSGDGALALVSQWDVDLILVSEDLPGRSGIEVTRLIHALRPRCPVIIMSKNAEPSLRAAARSAGAVDCLTKPLCAEHLVPWLQPPALDGMHAREAVAE